MIFESDENNKNYWHEIYYKMIGDYKILISNKFAIEFKEQLKKNKQSFSKHRTRGQTLDPKKTWVLGLTSQFNSIRFGIEINKLFGSQNFFKK